MDDQQLSVRMVVASFGLDASNNFYVAPVLSLLQVMGSMDPDDEWLFEIELRGGKCIEYRLRNEKGEIIYSGLIRPDGDTISDVGMGD